MTDASPEVAESQKKRRGPGSRSNPHDGFQGCCTTRPPCDAEQDDLRAPPPLSARRYRDGRAVAEGAAAADPVGGGGGGFAAYTRRPSTSKLSAWARRGRMMCGRVPSRTNRVAGSSQVMTPWSPREPSSMYQYLIRRPSVSAARCTASTGRVIEAVLSSPLQGDDGGPRETPVARRSLRHDLAEGWAEVRLATGTGPAWSRAVGNVVAAGLLTPCWRARQGAGGPPSGLTPGT